VALAVNDRDVVLDDEGELAQFVNATRVGAGEVAQGWRRDPRPTGGAQQVENFFSCAEL
jgi:hypothetical protein